MQVPSGNMRTWGQLPPEVARSLISWRVFCRDIGSSRFTKIGCVIFMYDPMGESAVSVFPTTEGIPRETTTSESKNEECGASTIMGASANVARRPLCSTHIKPPEKNRAREKKIKSGKRTRWRKPDIGREKSILRVASSPTRRLSRKNMTMKNKRNGSTKTVKRYIWRRRRVERWIWCTKGLFTAMSSRDNSIDDMLGAKTVTTK